MTLLEECLDSLRPDVDVISGADGEALFDALTSQVPFTAWGRIDWNNVADKTKLSKANLVHNSREIFSSDELKRKAYVLWNDEDLPILTAPLGVLVSQLDNVTAVSFDTWIFGADSLYVVEFYHDGEIILSRRRGRTSPAE